ncbi:hypothetical protein [Gemmata sp.]|uniref:hypothetical protein n=1 Tax=Gemmata sp. TaxID=1914242 RepID=UPI003F704A5B
MIRAVVWKELREQGLIGLALVALGSGVLAAAAALADPPAEGARAGDVVRHLGLGLLATLMLCVTAGMVCGGAVFAAEREAGTMGFLDALPAARWRLWRAKVAAGTGLAAAQVGALLAVAAALGLVPTLGWARAAAVFAMLSFVWGVFGSTVSRTTLGAIGAAIPGALAAAVASLVPVTLVLATFAHDPAGPALRPAAAAAFLGFMLVAPLGLSAWVFTRPDRLRAADDEAADVPREARARSRPRAGGRALVWLGLRQLRGPAAALAGFALVFGLGLLARDARPVLVWPGLALAAGTLAGVTAFADEQTRGVARFWGEQRLPLGRAWAAKVGLHFLLCLALLLVLAAPAIGRAQVLDRAAVREHTALAVVFRSPLFDELGRHAWKYLLVPAVYGFAAGHLCGLLFRKLVVACGVAGIVGGAGAVAWGPSLLAGGVWAWQLWLPPALLLATARALVHPWATDRLGARGPLVRLAAGGLAAAAALGAGLAYRVLEVPDRPDAEADVAYVAALPPLDTNRGGTAFRNAVERHARVAAALAGEADGGPPPPQRRPRVEDRLSEVIVKGWPTGDAELAAWLDRVYAPDPTDEPWYATAGAAAALPVGVFEYPQLIGVAGPRDAALVGSHRMALTILARGLRAQAAGDPDAFAAAFRVAVALARTLRNGSIVAAYHAGRLVEEAALQALDRWLEALPPQAGPVRAALAPFPALGAAAAAGFDRPDLLRALIADLEPGDPTGPFDPVPHFLSERYVIREAMASPAQWLPNVLGTQDRTAPAPEAQPPEVELVSMAWAVPWERERTRRLLGLGFETGLPADPGLISGRPGAALLIRPRLPAELADVERGLRSHRRAALLKLALRAHRAELGRYPPDDGRPDPLGALVERGYLRRVPPDAFDEARGFGYRVGPPGGEAFRPPPRGLGGRATRAGDAPGAYVLPEGHAMLWCAGPARGGPGAPPPGPGAGGSLRPEDLVYLVPHGPVP